MKLLTRLIFAFLIFSISGICIITAQTLAGTDALSRTPFQNDSAGNPKKDKYVAMVYFLTHGDRTADDYWDLREIVPNHPEVLEDYDNQYCGKLVFYEGRPCPTYYWSKPIYGYYRADNYWVVLKSLQILTDDGVDILVIDATNASVYADCSDLLMKAGAQFIIPGFHK